MLLCVCMCLCVCEQESESDEQERREVSSEWSKEERQGERKEEKKIDHLFLLFLYICEQMIVKKITSKTNCDNRKLIENTK
jgi:hypothetical protein